MAIKIQNSTIIDDGRNIVDAGIGTFTTRVDVGTGGSIFSADANVSNDNILSVKNTSQNPAFDITGTGSVGIGITNPSKSLHVDGTGLLVASGSTTLFSVESFTPNTNVFEVYDRENSIILGVSTNSIGIGSTNPLTITPQVTQTAIGVGTDEILRLARNTDNQNIFSVLDAGSSPLFNVTTSGDVGIGTTNPSQKLHVDGNFLVSDGETVVLSALSGSNSNILSVKKQSSNPAFDITGIGSVGIGTTQPSGVFEVHSGSNSILSVKDTALEAGANIFQILDFDGIPVVGVTTNNIGIGTVNKLTVTPQVTQTAIGVGTAEILTLASNINNQDIFSVIDETGGITHLTVTNAGLIGIGTTNPAEKLHLEAGNLLISDGTSEVFYVSKTGSNVLSIQNQSSNPAFDVTGIGSVGIGTTQPSSTFQVVSAGSELFSVSSALSDIIFEIDTDKFVMNSSGDAGIGTTNPTSKLDVRGDISLVGIETYTTTIQSITATADRYISFPDQTGVVALVQGINGAVQYNNAGYSAGGNLGYGNTTGTFGYIAGGGSVTQATNKSTGVTLNSPCGRITMNAANLSPGTPVTFTMTNNKISANDLLILNHVSGGTAGRYALNAQCSAGSANINVTNVGLTTLGEAILIGFAVIKTTI